MSAPLASIAIPVHNGMPYVERAVADALAQDYPNLEVIVVDNASTDGTADFLASVGDPRLRVVTRSEVQPAAENWTQAVRESAGDFVKVMCADDELLPHALRLQIDLLREQPEAVLAAARRRIIDEQGKTLKSAHGLDGLRGVVQGQAVVKSCMIAGTNLLGEVVALTFRGDAIRAAMPWDASLPYMLDMVTYAAVLKQGPAVCDRHVLAAFRVSPTSWSSALLREQPVQFRTWRDAVQRSGWVVLTPMEKLRAAAELRLRTTARRAYFARVRRQANRQSV